MHGPAHLETCTNTSGINPCRNYIVPGWWVELLAESDLDIGHVCKLSTAVRAQLTLQTQRWASYIHKYSQQHQLPHLFRGCIRCFISTLLILHRLLCESIFPQGQCSPQCPCTQVFNTLAQIKRSCWRILISKCHQSGKNLLLWKWSNRLCRSFQKQQNHCHKVTKKQWRTNLWPYL